MDDFLSDWMILGGAVSLALTIWWRGQVLKSGFEKRITDDATAKADLKHRIDNLEGRAAAGESALRRHTDECHKEMMAKMDSLSDKVERHAEEGRTDRRAMHEKINKVDSTTSHLEGILIGRASKDA